jgi:hypothetical protein
MKYIAEVMADAFRELIRRYIEILQKYPPDDVIRVAGEPFEITPDDLRGEFDIEIDIGVGPQDKAQAVAQLDQHIGFLINVGIPSGLATPVHLAKAVVRKYKMAGINAVDLMFSEDEIAGKMQDKDFVNQLDGMIKKMSSQGAKPEQIGMMLLETIGGYMNEREQQGQPAQGKDREGGGAPQGQGSGPQGSPGPV